MRKTTTVLAMTGVLALGGAASAVAATSGSGSASHPRLSAAAAEKTNATASASIAATCSGGVQKRVFVKSNDPTYYFYSGNVGANLPGVSTAISGPSSGNDTLVVTFNASDYVGSSTPVGVDIILDGTKMTPNSTFGTHFIGQSDSGVDSDSVQFCRRVGPGAHYLYVRPSFYGGATSSSYAYFYDYSLKVEVAE